MTDAVERKTSGARIILLGLLAILSLACLSGGGTPYVMAIESWADHDRLFSGFLLIDWLVGLIGAAFVAAGLILAGIFLRLLPWARAPLAGLLLAMLSTAFLLCTFLIYSQTGHDEDSIEVVLLQGLCILGLFVVALPPFLHWLLARRSMAERPTIAAAPHVKE